MEFRKQISIPKSSFKINHSSCLVSVGSCFADNIGSLLESYKFDVLQNPLGVIFNPISLGNIFLSQSEPKVFETRGKWFSWDAHSSLTDVSLEVLLKKLQAQKDLVNGVMSQANCVFITFGSAWCYELKEDKSIVANCHKMPQNLFDKRLLCVDEIVQCWTKILAKFPNANFIFTVSPVRHWKDGVRENNVSKGVLHQAVHELMELNKVGYFPAYEIVLDELRDYRFYKNDMLHPNELAVAYVWEQFQDCYFSEATKNIVNEVAKLNNMTAHRIMDENSEEKKKFEMNLTKQKELVSSLLH